MGKRLLSQGAHGISGQRKVIKGYAEGSSTVQQASGARRGYFSCMVKDRHKARLEEARDASHR